MSVVGKLEQVDLRHVWAPEALRFTAWMGQNLDILGEAIGRSLSLLQADRDAVVRAYLHAALGRQCGMQVQAADRAGEERGT